MAAVKNPLTAMSYTAKDFPAIFDELLELTKKLTYKWDPTITNESDPGIILLKLNAIIADKNNYNIDKNILEAFPETVTQDVSARNMYKQLAYIMPWYRSASTMVSFKWKGEAFSQGELVTIPRFTMITDKDNSVIYTLVEDVQFSKDNEISSALAMQGTINDLVVSGSNIIALNNIDYNNRLYINDYNAAENGIFISNVNESVTSYWTRVDNLQVMPVGNKYYEFGVDSRSNNTYIEFPTDIESLIKAGLNVKYLISDGLDGNVGAKQLTKFYEDVTVTFRGEQLNLNEELVSLYNPSGSSDGANPEPVSKAYNSYKKVAGTFDTLITLRDYMNAIYQSGLCSNDIVADRLHDIQSSYKIVTDNYGSNDSIIEYGRHLKSSSADPQNPESYSQDLSPYDLKLYILQNGGLMNKFENFNKTFELERSDSSTINAIEGYLTSTKSMQHNYTDIIPNVPCMYRVVYPIKIKFTPQYQLDNIQVDSIRRNIVQALYENLNSRELEFGVEPDYNFIYDVIINADERIKLVTIDDFQYTTYATYFEKDSADPSDVGTFKSIPISEFNDPWIIEVDDTEDILELVKDLTNPAQYIFVSKKNHFVYKYDPTLKTKVEYSKLMDDFRLDIITKSVLAGVTPLYQQETSFKYSIDQKWDGIKKDVDRVSTDLVISPWGFDQKGNPQTYDPKNASEKSKNYQLKPNETLQFYAPSFISERNFSNYVKFELILGSPSSEGKEYRIANRAYFYYEVVNDDNGNSSYKASYDGQSTGYLYKVNDKGEYKLYLNLSNTKVYKDNEKDGPDWETSVHYFVTEVVKFPNGIGSWTSLTAWERDKLTLYTENDIYQIPADTEYRLTENDYITFFWKEEDSDDAPYKYIRYKGIKKDTDTEKSPIVKPTFTINGNAIGRAKINPRYLNKSGEIKFEANAYSTYQRIAAMYGDNSLSGSKAIDIRKINQVIIEPSTKYYYLITNTIKEEKDKTQYYEMPFTVSPAFKKNAFCKKDKKPLSDKPNDWGTSDNTYDEILSWDNGQVKETAPVTFTYDYILKADEYFIHTNRDLTQYEMLQTGSLIRLLSRPGDGIPVLKSKVVDYNDLAINGIEVIADKLCSISVKALLREQQIYSLSGGDMISIQLDDKFDGIPANLNDDENTSYLAYPYFRTDEPVVFDNFTVLYATDAANLEAAVFKELPKIEVDDEHTQWRGTATLNLNMTPDEPQILDNRFAKPSTKQSKQQIIIGSTKTGAETVIPTDPMASNKTELLSNIQLTKVGGNNIDVTYLNGYGQRTNINIFAFELHEAFNTVPFETTPDSGIRMRLFNTGYDEKALENVSVTVDESELPQISYTIGNLSLEKEYNYILGIRNTSTSILFNLKGENGEFIECLNSELNKGGTPQLGMSTSPTKSAKYYFLIKNSEDNPFTKMTITISGEDLSGTLDFDNLVKCSPNLELEKYGAGISSLIEERIRQLDYHGYFKYNYLVPAEKQIEDPLIAATFFNENHVANKYTIPHINLMIPADAKSNTKASRIDIINNR